ncbi:hypothetical protein E2C01_099289 [Portunus trituberculatus]|uniref:Uncharacterized protein n=1 Tax=Portunus trituberculatus TaxID=210409 RepID=A0A5B7KAL2_PORTR|nr:hypothetical protein [Portunus trituberculatus]
MKDVEGGENQINHVIRRKITLTKHALMGKKAMQQDGVEEAREDDDKEEDGWVDKDAVTGTRLS